ncbi:MAG TPA: DPP IV N-terminal domain-containing protein, partial [Gemmataceae bacterium]|nr:DPP IV N-terminal domain-containing protein [Gemmataceae bacterium]
MANLTRTLLLCACLLTSGVARSQDRKPAKDRPLDTSYLRLHAQTRGFMLGRPVKPQPTPDGKAVLFLRAQARVPRMALYEYDLTTAKTRELASADSILGGNEEKLSAEEKARRERMRVSVGGFTDYQLSDDGALVLLALSGKLYAVNRASGAVEVLPAGNGTILDPKFSPNARYVSYVRDHDVCVLDRQTRKESAVTSGGSERLTHGLPEFVAEEEMHRHTGYWWSPDSRRIAFEESDTSAVETWFVADPAHPEQKPHPSFYPRPGKANAKVRLGVVPLSGGNVCWIDWNRERYPYLARVNWEEHGPLALQVQTRDQKELVLLKADPESGRTTPLLSETDPAWVNLQLGTPRWLTQDRGFIWSAGGSDGPRLEHRGADGKLLAVLCPAEAGFQGVVDVDSGSGEVIYQASQDPTETRLFRVSLDSQKPVILTRGPGIHNAVFGKGSSVYALESASSHMPRTTVHSLDGGLLATLPSVAEDPPFLPNSWTAKVGDGPGYYAVVVRPRDFDTNKRYPVIVSVYGGPGFRMVQAAMHRLLLNQWLADQGFVVVSLDGRGTPGRSHDWERAISKHFGSVPLDDQVAGL